MSEVKEVKDVVEFSIERTEEGTTIHVKSPMFQKFFEGFAVKGAPLVTHNRWKGVEMLPIPSEIVTEHFVLQYGDVATVGEKLIVNGKANLAFMRHKDLGKGLSFTVGTIPVREAYLDTFLDLFCKAVKEVYNGYMRPFQSEVLVISRTHNLGRKGE